MAALSAIGAVVGLASSFISARGTLAAGKAEQAALEYQAKQLDIKANEELAAAQQEAQQERRKKNLLLSALQARSAASGFSASDDTTMDLADEIARYGTLNEQLRMYGGYSRRGALQAEAAGRRLSGRAAVRGSQYGAAGTILGGLSGFAKNFGGSFTPSSSGYFG